MRALTALIEQRLAAAERPLVVGIAGSQGSGKSTIAAELADRFTRAGVPTAALSLDDLYRTRAEREALAREVHPLLRTRGVPGTHDVALGLAILDAIDAGEGVALPRFDKAADDRAPEAKWGRAAPGTRLVLLEGWCLGAGPQGDAALAEPVNALEAEEDRDGRWRRFADEALGGDYRTLFARIDLLVFLAAPDFETVFGWRAQQERDLRARTGRGQSEAGLIRFVRHYERITRWMLADLPGRADLTIRLDAARVPVAIERRTDASPLAPNRGIC